MELDEVMRLGREWNYPKRVYVYLTGVQSDSQSSRECSRFKQSMDFPGYACITYSYDRGAGNAEAESGAR